MPIYEYACPSCGEQFEKLVRSITSIDEVTCPVCASTHVKRRLSVVAASVSSGSGGASASSAACAPGGT